MQNNLIWKPEYCIDNGTIDTQHKKLLNLCQTVAASKQNATKSEAIDIFHNALNELSVYAQTHFFAEENLLRSVKYPQLSEQIKEHEEYSEKLVIFLSEASIGLIDDSALASYLEKWWINHILVSDTQYKPFL